MSPTNKKKLYQLRIKLDKLDNELLKIIKKRSLLVNEVLKVKIHKKEIIDQQRINFILNKIKKKINSIQNRPKNYKQNMEKYDLVFYRLRKKKF